MCGTRMHNDDRNLLTRLYATAIDLLLIAFLLYLAAELIRAVWVVVAITSLVLVGLVTLIGWYRAQRWR